MNPLERFKDLGYGKLAAVCQKVSLAGGDDDDVVERVLSDDLTIVLESGRQNLFTPPEELARNVLEINEVLWKDLAITEAAIRELGDPPACPPSDEHNLHCVFLRAETGNPLVTFARNWAACRLVLGLPRTWKWDGLILTPQGVRQNEGALVRQPGVSWGVAELGRKTKGKCVHDTRRTLGASMMGQDGTLVAAQHPNWAWSMNGADIPFLDLPGLDVAPDARGEFNLAPCLDFNRGSRRVLLDAVHVGLPSSGYGSGSLLQ